MNDTDFYSLGASIKFPGLFGLENWVPNASAVYADSDIDFNDAQAWIVSFAMFRKF